MLIVMLHTGNWVAFGWTNWKPESTPVTRPLPSVMLEQGAANVDCVTVWFLERNWNWIVSPFCAVTLRRIDNVSVNDKEAQYRGCYGPVGVVGQRPILADLDGDGLLGERGTNGQESGNDSGETHRELGRKVVNVR